MVYPFSASSCHACGKPTGHSTCLICRKREETHALCKGRDVGRREERARVQGIIEAQQAAWNEILRALPEEMATDRSAVRAIRHALIQLRVTVIDPTYDQPVYGPRYP